MLVALPVAIPDVVLVQSVEQACGRRERLHARTSRWRAAPIAATRPIAIQRLRNWSTLLKSAWIQHAKTKAKQMLDNPSPTVRRQRCAATSTADIIHTKMMS